MRVLITVPRLTMPGGVSNYYLVLRPYLEPGKEYFEVGAEPSARAWSVVAKRMLLDYWRFHRTLSSGQFDLVHLNPSLDPRSLIRDAIFVLIAAAHQKPTVVFFHGWGRDLQALIARRFRWLFLAVFGKAAGFIVLAQLFRQQLQEMAVRTPILLMTTPVDDAIFAVPRATRDEKEVVDILFLSRLAENKGAVEAIKAFALLKERVPHVALTVAGDGPEKEKAVAVVEQLELDGVRFLGHVQGPAKQEAFLQADIYFFPTSYDEGLPTTVVEAMAYGLPVITRSVGGLRDFFQDPSMGFITAESDPREFAAMLERLTVDSVRRKQIGEFNRRYAKEHFAASAVARRLEGIYERLAG